jgi:NAD(P)-dependent dehydrogenase (short-subunit alcohol dehydrogenase family)
MMQTSVQFSWAEIQRFSEASGDHNPLHISADYARRTPYGEPVVFGVLGGITALAALPDRPGSRLTEVSLDFAGAMLTDIPYRLEIKDGDQKATAKLYDGKRLLLKLVAKFRPGDAAFEGETDWQPDPHFEVSDPQYLTGERLAVGDSTQGIYTPQSQYLQEWLDARGLVRKGVSAPQLAALMWVSYLVGMELPGQQALFSKLKLQFKEDFGDISGLLTYNATVDSFDDRFQLLRLSAQMEVGSTTLATADIRAFLRPESPVSQSQTITELLPTSDRLQGKVALVIGGSRGLGAAITIALAQQGCTTIVNFHRSAAEATTLQQSLQDAPGEVVLLQGDAADGTWCGIALEKIETTYGRLDFLICNACPPILPLWLEPTALPRIHSYIEKSLALMSTPMATFLNLLSAHGGWNIAISSIYATGQAPADLPHYVAAKSAIEGLVRAASWEYEQVQHCIVRPPKLLTDQTNTPLSRQGAISPETVAASLVKTLTTTETSGSLKILEYSSEERN